MGINNNLKIRINKISLFLNIILALSSILLLTSTPLFESLFFGELRETIVCPNYTEKYKNGSYFLTIFKYIHLKGKPIENVSLDYRIENTGSYIDYYEPYFKTLYNKKSIKQEKGNRYLRIEIPEIRPNDEFDIRIYSKSKPDIKSIIRMKNGFLVNDDTGETIRNPVYWLIIFIAGFFIISIVFCYKTIRQIQLEKERIIGERNALQQILLKGDRLSSRRKKT